MKKCLMLVSCLLYVGVVGAAEAKTEMKTETAKKTAREPAASCPKYSAAGTSVDKALADLKAAYAPNGLVFANCRQIVKDSVNPNASAVLKGTEGGVQTGGIKTTTVFECDCQRDADGTIYKSKGFVRISSFKPTEDAPRYNGFNRVESGDGCSFPAGAHVSAELSVLSL